MSSLSVLLNNFYQPNMVVSFVGAGGKTSSIFELAQLFNKQNKKIAITTTTHIFNPKCEENRSFNDVITDFKMPETNGIFVFGKSINSENKLTALSFDDIKKLSSNFDLVLVEADGARKKLVKAPNQTEPVITDFSNIVVGVINLKCLNQPLNQEIAHRPELFAAITTCKLEEDIKPKHLISLINHQNGLFKNCPLNAVKIVFFNCSNAASKEEIAFLTKQLEHLTITFFF